MTRALQLILGTEALLGIVWTVLAAMAHGAGLMLVPIYLGLRPGLLSA